MSRTSSCKPANWPPGVEYVRTLKRSKQLPPDAVAAISVKPAGTPSTSIPPGPCSKVRIRPIEDANHPAKGQHGLFASQPLPPDMFILPYLGLVHTELEADPSSDYDISLDREAGLAVDATRLGNEARFINDYRGVALAPNAEFRDVWVDIGRGCTEKRVAVYVLSAGKSGGKRAKGIAKAEEILVSYGKGFWVQRPA